MKQQSTLSGTLERDTARPFYQQIKDSIVEMIHNGVWTPGEKVPSEHALVEELGVSRMTVNRALRELTQQGHLTRVHGVGTFVAEPAVHGSLLELNDIAEEIVTRGGVHHARVQRLQTDTADTDTARRLEIEPGTAVYHIVLLHHQDQVPVQLEDRYVNPQLVPDFMQVDFDVVTPTRYLVSLFRPDEMEHTVQAVMPDQQTCDTLAIQPVEPCLLLSRRTWKRSQVVTSVSLLYPSSRYHLHARYANNRYRKV